MLLRKHFRHLPCYTDLLDIFHEVTCLYFNTDITFINIYLEI